MNTLLSLALEYEHIEFYDLRNPEDLRKEKWAHENRGKDRVAIKDPNSPLRYQARWRAFGRDHLVAWAATPERLAEIIKSKAIAQWLKEVA